MARRAPESEERVEALYQKLRAKMPLHELRQAQALSQRVGNHCDFPRGPGKDRKLCQLTLNNGSTTSGHSETQKPRIARLSCLVGPHGLEPWTKGL